MKKHIILMVLMSALIALAACGTETENNDASGHSSNAPETENSASNESEENHESETPEESETDEDESNDAAENTDDDSDTITETGIYNGQADPHTIEIETDEGPVAFQLTMEARDDVEQLTVDEDVTYTYTEDGDTRTIESIKPAQTE